MTFYEAAVEVLREAARPLHFKKITEIAIKRSLLSHVGTKPDETMSARLAQEARKSPGESLIENVRPGVFALRSGADVSDAAETIRLREPPPEPEPPSPPPARRADEPPPAQAPGPTPGGSEDSSQSPPEPAPAPPADPTTGDPASGAAEPRDGADAPPEAADAGDGNTPDDGDEEDDESTDGDSSSAGGASTPDGEGRSGRRRRRRGRRGGKQRPESDPAPRPLDSDAAESGPLAAALVDVFVRTGRRDIVLERIAQLLCEAPIGAATRIGPSAARGVIESANRRRTSQGRPPLFIESRPNIWTLATPSGAALAESYQGLTSWQSEHRRRIRSVLQERVSALDGAALATVVTLLAERLGFEQIVAHERVGREQTTLSCLSPRAFSQSRVAIRIQEPRSQFSRNDLLTFRGSLHLYGAGEGIVVSVAGFENGVEQDAAVPNLAPISLLGRDELAERMQRVAVGTGSFSMEVAYIDEGFFRDFRGD